MVLDADPLRLVQGRATREADLQSPVGQMVGERDLFAQDQRVMVRSQDDARPDPNPSRATSGVHTMQQRSRTQVSLDEMMLGKPHVAKARFIRILHLLDRIAIHLRSGDAAGSVERDEQTEVHCLSPDRAGIACARP